MNKVIAEVTTEQKSVLHGDHQIISTVALKDDVEPFDAGTLLFEGASGGFEPLNKTDKTNSPIAVAIDNLTAKASAAVINAVIHGVVRGEKLLFSDGSAATESQRAKLRDAGIYAIGAMAEDPAAQS